LTGFLKWNKQGDREKETRRRRRRRRRKDTTLVAACKLKLRVIQMVGIIAMRPEDHMDMLWNTI